MTECLTAVILQGGGALGAYQAGVFEELIAHDIKPDWVIGTSIGAINGALIAGNKPENRLAKLTSFWQTMARTGSWLDDWSPGAWADMFNPFSSVIASAVKNGAVLGAITHGVNGFFRPRVGAGIDLSAPVQITDAGFYDTTPLRQTLLDHVDFDYLNSGTVRLSVCAVDIETAELVIFDTHNKASLGNSRRMGPEHIMASGALPPAFPPVIIDKRAYWDGGIVSNTPLDVLLAEDSTKDALVFMVDLWNSSEAMPKTMAEVMDRQKAIQYADRASTVLTTQQRIEELQQAIRALAAALPKTRQNDPQLAPFIAKGAKRTVNVVRLIMHALHDDDQFKDFDFSTATVSARWAAGKADAARAFKHKSWLKSVPAHTGLTIHELEQVEPSH